MHRFKELNVWKKAMIVSEMVYECIANFPKDERYGITSQISRSAVSIPSNIAEGAGRGSNKEFIQFLNIALGSSFELETQLILANKFKYLNQENLENITKEINDVQNMIYGLQNKLKQQI